MYLDLSDNYTGNEILLDANVQRCLISISNTLYTQGSTWNPMCWDFSCYYCAGLLLEDKHVNSHVSLDIGITVSGAQQSHLSVLQKQHL